MSALMAGYFRASAYGSMPPVPSAHHPVAALKASSAVPRGLIAALWRDPAHWGERLVMTAVAQLGDESRRFAVAAREAQPQATRDELCHHERRRVITISQVDGAVAGTPFFIALIPAYVAFLWEQVRMTLRIAALYDRDLDPTTMAAEILWLRGVHPTIAEAHAAVTELEDRPDRRFSGGVKEVYDVVRRFLVLLGLLGEPKPGDDRIPKWRRYLLLGVVFAFGAATWILTWFFPVTLMILIAYSCDGSTRRLAARALEHSGGGASYARIPRRRPGIIAALVALTIAVPLALVVWGVQHSDSLAGSRRTFIGLLGLAIVLAMSGWLRVRVPRWRQARASQSRAA
jgi:hypothetical protein